MGAGPSGLACAERLHQAGLDVVVLEARDRVGGRMWTDTALLPGTAAELGALMIHGRHVATHRWAAEAGLTVEPYPTTQGARFVCRGAVSSTLRFPVPRPGPFGPTAFLQGLRGIPRALDRYAGPEITFAEFLDRGRFRPAGRLVFELIHVHTWATDAEEIGVLAAREEAAQSTEPFGFRNFRVREGYSELARRKARFLGERVRLGVQVERIRWSGALATVEGRDRTSGEAVLRTARRVVLTVPLGVLRAGSIVFDPELSEAKRSAIRTLGLSRAVSVALRLRGSTLRRRLGRFILLWGGSASSFLRPSFESAGTDEVLVAFTAGREATRRAALSDRELVDATLEELRATVGDTASIGTCDGFAISRWVTDPFAQGAYSFPAPGSHPSHRRALAAAEGDRLFFAGEATHFAGEPATVHGAIETGRRAADEVLKSRATTGS
ncbi:MAG: FAD-dependent oxidoreductase [Thermoplasmata archaeon]|nr:FAD-dependent oxidoreductase [Thermoplasmata archaeon]